MDGCLLATLERIVENLEQAEDDLLSMAGTSVGKISDKRKECRKKEFRAKTEYYSSY